MKPSFLNLLEKRKQLGSFRSLSLFKDYIDFYSNDYLGLSTSVVNQKTTAGSDSTKGSTGSRLISGNSKEAMACEAFLSEYFESESALVFNSGYDANLGLFSSVPQKGDTIIYDSLIHASIRDGIRLSHAKSYSFVHNDLEDLDKKLQLKEGTTYVVVESLYSMDGDLCPLDTILKVCEKHHALLIVDEAHAAGVLGHDGKGLSFHKSVFARVVTFGKAYGFHGAVVLGSTDLTEYLINFSRSFIYTTALPVLDYTTICNKIVQSGENELREQLYAKIHLFRKTFEYDGISSEISPIQIIDKPGIKNALNAASLLQKEKIAVKAILSPTVKEGKERIRICLHTFNKEEDIVLLTRLLRTNY